MDEPDRAARLIDWILRQATAQDEFTDVLSGVCAAVVREGLPLWRASLSIPTVDPSARAISIIWWRDGGISLEAAPHTADAEAQFRRSPIFHMRSRGLAAHRWRLDRAEACEELPLLDDLRRQGGTDYVMRIVAFSPAATALEGAALAFATDRPNGFAAAEIALLDRLVPALGLAAYRIGLARITTDTLSIYLGPQTGRRVLDGEIRRGRGHTISAAILMADLRGFTALSEREDAQRVVEWLDAYLEAMGHHIPDHGGEVLKFLGDGLLAVFPLAEAGHDPRPVCDRAVIAAREALERTGALNRSRRERGLPTLDLDVVLHFGDVVYGNVGTARRLDFTVIGRAVNEASRMEALCGTIGHHLLLSDSFARRCSFKTESLGLFRLRGIDGDREIRTLPSLAVLRRGDSVRRSAGVQSLP